MLLRIRFLLPCVIAALTRVPAVYGHGTPIHVEVAENRLVVSNGLADDEGFASMIFLEDDEDGDGASLNVPTLGPSIVWQLPGLDIFGMNDESSLSIELLVRPAKDAGAAETRLLWYWNPETELVNQSPASFHLLGAGMRFSTLTPSPDAAPDPFLLADPIAGEQGFHNHSLLAYALDNDPAAPHGAYGFFARLSADRYTASDPFLLLFNHAVDYEQMGGAALAINTAAFLPGDYNHDDRVDSADYVVWRNALGSTTELRADGSGNHLVDEDDYNVWWANFGAIFDESSGGATGTSAAVPEPSMFIVAFTGTVIALAVCNDRCARAYRKRDSIIPNLPQQL
jgi:hypothetical protein